MMSNQQIKNYLDYIQQVTNSYTLNPEVSKKIDQHSLSINSRLKDSNLYVGIVGEFSSGKSTFINALLKDELLSTNILQATTCATTYIYYAPTIDVTVNLKNQSTSSISAYKFCQELGQEINIPLDSLNNWKELISTVTSEDHIASRFNSVQIYHPAKALNQGLVIIDTPGANSNVYEHTVIASQTIKQECDVAIILIPADNPLSETLIEFIKNNLADIIHRCIFLVTKIDKVRRSSQQEKLLASIRDRVCENLEVDHIRLLAVAPKIVIDQLNQDASDYNNDKLQKFNYQFEEVMIEIWETLEEQRNIIILEKINLVLQDIFKSLKEQLSYLEQSYLEETEAINKNKIPNFRHFIDSKKTEYGDLLKNQFSQTREEFKSSLNQKKQEIIAKFREEIRKQSNEQEINFYLNNKLNRRIESYINKCTEVKRNYTNKKIHFTTEQLKRFKLEFHQVYESLATLGGKIENSHIQEQQNENPTGGDISKGYKVQFDLPNIQENNGFGTGAGVVTGLALAAILPGVGFIIGSVLGGVLGSFFEPSSEEIQNQVLNEITPKLRQELDKINQNLMNNFGQGSLYLSEYLNQHIDQHFQVYKELADEMEEHKRQSYLNLLEKQKMIQKDLEMINQYNQQIKEHQISLKDK